MKKCFLDITCIVQILNHTIVTRRKGVKFFLSTLIINQHIFLHIDRTNAFEHYIIIMFIDIVIHKHESASYFFIQFHCKIYVSKILYLFIIECILIVSSSLVFIYFIIIY